jgi:hypothetical protein
MLRPLLIACALVPIVLTTACGGSSENEENEEAGASEEANENGAASVPRTVLSIEGDAEDAIDMVFADNWDRVSADAGSIASNWAEFVDSSEAGGVTDGQREAMDKAIADLGGAAYSEDGIGARQAANDVSKVIVDVFDLFEHMVPTDVGRLDWMERQVIIDADRDDWTAVQSDLTQTRYTFSRIKSDVSASGGEKEAADFEASLDKQARLASAEDTAIVDEANLALELVDALERVY